MVKKSAGCCVPVSCVRKGRRRRITASESGRCWAAVIFRYASCPDRGPWLELSAGKRNRLSAPHRAMCANCRETAIFSSPELSTSALDSRLRPCTWPQPSHSECRRRPAHGTIHPLRVCMAHFVIGSARSTAAQACCAPTCDVGLLVSLRLRCRPAHAER